MSAFHIRFISIVSAAILIVPLLHSADPKSAAEKAEARKQEETRLKELGEKVKTGQAEENKCMSDLKKEITKINTDPSIPAAEKPARLDKAFKDYQAKSRELTLKYRKEAQDELFAIANRGSDTGNVKETAGTKMGDAKHRGWTGDTDAGGSTGKTQRIVEAAKKMGLSVQESPGYIHVDGLDLTVHKEGAMGRPGTEAHFVQITVDAKSHETYVSSAMSDDQPGKKFVETNDHIKKAIDGATIPAKELAASPDKLQGLVKGTLKSCESSSLPPERIQKIMDKHGYKGSASDFKAELEQLKTGKSVASETAGLDNKKLEKMQSVCKDVLIEAKTAAASKYETEVFKAKQEIAKLKAAGNKAEAAKKQEQLFDSMLRAKETAKVADSGLKKAGAQKLPPPPDTDMPSRTPAGSTMTDKISKGVGYAGAALSVYDAWKKECEDAKAEGRDVSYTRTGFNAALNLSGVTGYKDQAVAVHDQLTTKNTAYVDSQIDDLERAGYDLSKVSDARLMIITAKTTIRTAAMASYEAAKVIPVAGDLISGAENTVSLATSGYGAVMAEIEKNRILAENAAAQEATLDSAMARSRAAIPLLEKIADRYEENIRTMAALEKILGSYDNFIAVKQQIENNRRNCASLADYATEVRSGAASQSSVISLRSNLDTIRRESDRIATAAEALGKAKTDRKITAADYQKQGRKLFDSCLNAQENMAYSLKQFADIQSLAEAGPLVDGIKAYKSNIVRDSAEAEALSENASSAAAHYRKLIAEQENLQSAFDNIKKQTLDGIKFFSSKRTKAGSEQELQLDKAAEMIGKINLAKTSQGPADLKKTAERLEKMSHILDNVNAVALQFNTSAMDSKDVDSAKEALANLTASAEQAAGALERAINALNALNLEASSGLFSVKIVDADTKRPIAGAYAELIPQAGGSKMTSESNGDFVEISAVAPGVYTLNAKADGYDTVSRVLKLRQEDIDRGTSDDISLKPIAGKQLTREEVQSNAEIEKKAKNIDAAALEKAKDVINALISNARDGVIISPEYFIEGGSENTSFSSYVAEYSGAKFKGHVVSLFFMMRNPDGLELLRRGRQLTFAAMTEQLAKNMLSSGISIESLSQMKKAIETADKDDYVRAASEMFNLNTALMSETGLNASDIRYYRAYKDYYDKKYDIAKIKDKDGKINESVQDRASALLGEKLKKSGSLKFLSEFTEFWDSQDWKRSAPKNVAIAQTSVTARDYRRKYMRESIIPLLAFHAEKQRIEASKLLVAALDAFASGIKSAQVTVKTKITCAPECPQFRLETRIGKKQETKTVPVGEYLTQVKLTDMDGDNIYIVVRADKTNLWTSNAGKYDYSISLWPNQLPPGTKMRGFNIDIDLPPIQYLALRYSENKKFGQNETVKVPSRTVDRTSEIGDKMGQTVTALRSGTMTLTNAENRMSALYAEMNAHIRESVDSINERERAISQNYSVQERNASGASPEAKSAIYKEKQGILDSERNYRKQIENQADSLYRKYNAMLREESSKLQQQSSDLAKQWGTLGTEERKLNDEYSKVRGVITSAISDWQSISRSSDYRGWEYVTPENAFEIPGIDDNLAKYMKNIQDANDDFAKTENIKARLSDIQSRMNQLSDSITKIRIRRVGNYIFETQSDLRHEGGSGYAPAAEMRNRQKSIDTINMLASMKISELMQNEVKEAEQYLAKRGSKVKNIDSQLDNAMKLAEKLPSQNDVQTANAKMAAIQQKLTAYDQAISQAVLMKNTGRLNIPRDILDSRGSDTAFVSSTLDTMRDIVKQNYEVVGDILPAPYNTEKSAMMQLEEILSSVRKQNLSPEQVKKLQAIHEKLMPLYQGRNALYMLWSLKTFDAIEKLGKTPEERVKGLIELNKKAAQELEKSAGSINSASAADCAEWIRNASKWFSIMPDMPTLDNLRRRAEVFKMIADSGKLEAMRTSANLPPNVKNVTVNGTPVSADCGFILLRYNQLPALSSEMQKGYEKTEYAGKFKKAYTYRPDPPPAGSGLTVEMSYFNQPFHQFYDPGKPLEMPVSTEYLPMIMNMKFRQIGTDGKSSHLGFEPGLTIVVLP